MRDMDRQNIFDYVKKKYGTEPEYLWERYPSYAVLRHQDNGKWYGILLSVPGNKLGLSGKDVVDILDVNSGFQLYNKITYIYPLRTFGFVL